MSAPKGNQYWKERDWFGRKREFTPQELYNNAISYFEWCEQNPIVKEQIVNTKIGVQRVEEKFPRAFTIEGLCNYIGIVKQTLLNYEKLHKKSVQTEEEEISSKDYLDVITYVKQIIRSQKFEGAAVNIFNSNIISRDLGLVNKEAHEVVVEQPLFPNVHPDERDEAI